jgi:UDP-glucose 4-epimerase
MRWIRRFLGQIAQEHELESCIRFAALAYVGESVEDPKLYFENNAQKGIALIRLFAETRRASSRTFSGAQ